MRNSFILPLALTLLTAVTSGAAFGQLTWTEFRPVTFPEPRYGHTMSLVHPLYQPLLFGGTDGTTTFGDTWSWNGQNWQLVASTGPAPRHNHAMTSLHFTDDSLVMFGGRDARGDLLGDTWIFDGSTWSRLVTAVTPSARAGHAMAKDEFEIKTSLLFGGRTATGVSDETWLFVDGQWSLVPTTNRPPAREGHSLMYNTYQQTYLVFGGRNGSTILDDVWEFDGITWRQVDTLSSPVINQATVYEGQWRRRVVGFGGSDDRPSDVTIERLPGGTWVEQQTINTPPPRDEASLALAFTGSQNQILLFGGRDAGGTALGDTFALETLTLPLVQTFGHGCGPGAWGPTGGPNLFLFGVTLLGNSVSVSAVAPAPGRAVFVIGRELAGLPAPCSLLVEPTHLVLLPMEELFVGFAQAAFDLELPFVPSLAGEQIAIQLMLTPSNDPRRTDVSEALRITLAH